VRPYRLATADDVSALAGLYRDAALTLGPQVYSPAQVRTWAGSTADAAAFGRYILEADTWLTEDSAGPCGFCGVAVHGDAGEVHSLYVRAALTRQGLGTALLAHAMRGAQSKGARRFGAWATPFSRALFERAGFALESIAREPYQGVVFDRFRMATA